MQTSIHPSRRNVLIGLGAASALTLAAEPAAAGGESDRRIPRGLRPGGEFDEFLEQQAAEGFSGAVGVYRNGRTAIERAFGMADAGAGTPNETDTIYALGSITKGFTAVAVAQLAAAGEIAYTGTVGEYLDGFAPEIADKVQVHQMLTHTGGLGDYLRGEGRLDAIGAWTSEGEAWAAVMEWVRSDGLVAQPGASQNYSNTGFAVLGAIIESVSGMTYYEYMREHVFAAAGMKDADFYSAAQWRDDPRIAHPYMPGEDGERVDMIDQAPSFGMPDGGAFATAADLRRFSEALREGELLAAPHARLVNAPCLPLRPLETGMVAYNTYTGPSRIAGGQWVQEANGGATYGVSAAMQRYDATGWTVTVLSHYEPGSADGIASKALGLITESTT